MYNRSLFIFHRDLRIFDNTGLRKACEQSQQVITCFILDPQQVGKRNTYRSMNALQFMVESLDDLQNQLKDAGGKLHLFAGDSHKVLEKLIKQEKIEAVFSNKDYTPFALKRDEGLKSICLLYKIMWHQYPDALLTEPEEIVTNNGTPYTIFTPFFKKARTKTIERPITKKFKNFYTGSVADTIQQSFLKKIISQPNKKLWQHGGRKEGLKRLALLSTLKNYAKTKDYPSLDTSYLSAHLKFGTLSVRHVYHATVKKLGASNPLIRQLFWRDFFTHIAYDSPFVFGASYHEKYNDLAWDNDKKLFKTWCQGKTGFPIVDAGMRQLNATGFMHNRVRMIVASFLVKDLRIDWRWGEQYFASKLVDYDPAVNNGNWQWCASTGADAQPYFRIFNPWLQQKKFDPQCVYIKRWVLELNNSEPKIIHHWYKQFDASVGYPQPIVNHEQVAKKTIELYKNLK